jgi:hypothetical protein
MRKALLVATLAAVAAISFGCIVTDYPALQPVNRSHGLISCAIDDRVHNSQQTYEPTFGRLTYTNPALVSCGGGGVVFVSATVNTQDGRDWGRFLGSGADVDGVDWLVSSAAGNFEYYESAAFGMWPEAGGLRINDHLAGPRAFAGGNAFPQGGPCPDNRFFCGYQNGRIGYPTSNMIAEAGFSDPFDIAACQAKGARLVGHRVGSSSLDGAPGFCFRPNVQAIDMLAFNRGVWFFYIAYGGRSWEEHNPVTPMARRAGLAEFFQGGQLTVDLGDVQATLHGSLDQANGTMTLFLDGAVHEASGLSYTAENPLSITLDISGPRPHGVGNLNFGDANTRNEMLRIARLMLDPAVIDQPITIGGFVPEIGMTIPERTLMPISDSFRNLLDTYGQDTDGSGFGG